MSGPYDKKTIAEIIHDYAVVRGDLVEQYARDQLASIIEERITAAKAEAEREVWEIAAQRRQEARDLYVQILALHALVDEWRDRLPVGFLAAWPNSLDGKP